MALRKGEKRMTYEEAKQKLTPVKKNFDRQ